MLTKIDPSGIEVALGEATAVFGEILWLWFTAISSKSSCGYSNFTSSYGMKELRHILLTSHNKLAAQTQKIHGHEVYLKNDVES